MTTLRLCYGLIKFSLAILLIDFKETTAKTFSLNEAIKQGLLSDPSASTTTRTSIAATTSYSRLSGRPRPTWKTNPLANLENRIFSRRLSSPLKYKKQYQITTPLKPKRITDLLFSRNRYKNQAKKRDTSYNEHFTHKYIPLLKNLNMLIDNLFASESSETSKDRKYQEQIDNVSNERNAGVCRCDKKVANDISKSEEDETSTITATTLTPEISETADEIQAASSAIHNTAISDFGDNRPDKNISILSTRNTTSSWRNHTGHSERNGTSLYRSLEGNSTRNYRNNKYSTKQERDYVSKSDKEDPNSSARNNATSSGTFRLRGDRDGPRDSVTRQETKEIINPTFKTENINKHAGRGFFELEGEIKFETKGNKTEDSRPVPVYVRGKTTVSTTDRIIYNAETFENSQEEWQNNFSKFVTGDKRINNGSGSIATENKTLYKPNQGMIPSHDINNPPLVLHKNWNNSTLVTIFDGYSVARGKNSEKKLAEESIFIYH